MSDAGGEREDAGGDAGADAGDGSAAVAFEVELALESVVDGLDDLAKGFEVLLARAWFLALLPSRATKNWRHALASVGAPSPAGRGR